MRLDKSAAEQDDGAALTFAAIEPRNQAFAGGGAVEAARRAGFPGHQPHGQRHLIHRGRAACGTYLIQKSPAAVLHQLEP